MGVLERKLAVQRYVHEVLDGGNAEVLREICTPTAVQRFPGITVEGLDRMIAGLSRITTVYSSFKTTVHAVIAEENHVAVHLTHQVTIRNDLRTRIGNVSAAGQAVTWDAIARFRFEGDLIAEEWIARDDLGVLLQLGAVAPG